jgi:hypothetical protein
MKDRKFVDSIDYFVYVSAWQYNKFREHFKIPEYKSFVIKNATQPFEIIPKPSLTLPVVPQNKIKLLYKLINQWNSLLNNYIANNDNNNVKLLNIANIVKEKEDFTFIIEPSEKGGAKIANLIIKNIS